MRINCNNQSNGGTFNPLVLSRFIQLSWDARSGGYGWRWGRLESHKRTELAESGRGVCTLAGFLHGLAGFLEKAQHESHSPWSDIPSLFFAPFLWHASAAAIRFMLWSGQNIIEMTLSPNGGHPSTQSPFRAHNKKIAPLLSEESPQLRFLRSTFPLPSVHKPQRSVTVTNLHSVNITEDAACYYPSPSNSPGAARSLHTHNLIQNRRQKNGNNNYANIWCLCLWKFSPQKSQLKERTCQKGEQDEGKSHQRPLLAHQLELSDELEG